MSAPCANTQSLIAARDILAPLFQRVHTSVGPPLAKSQRQKLKSGEATDYSHIAMCLLAVRFYPMVLVGLPGQ